MKRPKVIVAALMIAIILSLFQQSSTPVRSQTEFFNMSYLFFGSPNTYVSQVDKTQGSLDVISPNYFDISAEEGEVGELKVTWRLQTSFIDEMHRRGKKVVPFLANHWNKEAGIKALAEGHRDQLAQQIAQEIERYNLDGVNVDIEGVNEQYRDAHTDFIRLLRKYIPDHKEVSVAVAANPSGWKLGWHGFYDYPALAKYADYLMIMAYDESWEGSSSPIGPVSSISFFERSVQYAINQGVPRDRIVVGLPFYGRMWKTDGPTADGVSILGRGLSSTTIEKLIKEQNATVKYDEQKQSAYATFTIPEGQTAFAGSTKLTAGEYTIWYDNEEAIKAKLRVPSKFGIKGTGSWALYHEVPEMWNYYSAWLNGTFLTDTTDPEESTDTNQPNQTDQTNPSTPEDSTGSNNSTGSTISKAPKNFTDVSSDYWARESIQRVAGKGWMNGITDTEFAPNKTLTRAEGAAIIVRALGLEDSVPKSYTFTDAKKHWARQEIEVAREQGYVSGKTETTFAPNAPLTRQELAKILYNIFDFPVEKNVTNPFPDISPSRWSYTPILALHRRGVIGGFKDGTFRPTQISSRAHMATFMDRMLEDFEQKRNQ